MAMRESCIHFVEHFRLPGGNRSYCRLGLAPDAPKKCPPRCASFERAEEKKKSKSTESTVDQLSTLARLRRSGDITEAEFQDLKARLISENGGDVKPATPKTSADGPWNDFLKSLQASNDATARLLGGEKVTPRSREQSRNRKEEAKPKSGTGRDSASSQQPLAVGEEVIHNSLGSGVVVACDGVGHLSSITVRFVGGETKRVLAVHLKRVD
jgi:hypothetical protein